MTNFIKGCIAFSLIALVVVIVIAINEDEPAFVRYGYINDSISQGANVLAVDSEGAVTQTAAGKVLGFKRGTAAAIWEESFERFDKSTNAVRNAAAHCALACPAAMLELPERTIGVGGADPTGSLARTLGNGEADLVQPIDNDSLFVNRKEGNTTGLFTMHANPSTPGAPSQISTGLRGAGYLGLSADRKTAVAGLAGDDSAGAGLRLRALKRSGNQWRATGPSYALSKNANACISPGGDSIGIVDGRLRIVSVGTSRSRTVGPRLIAGTCTIDDSGAVTLAYNPADRPQNVSAARFTATGKGVWSSDFGAVRLLSKADAKFVALRGPTGRLNVHDVVTGKELLNDPLDGVPPGGGGLGIGKDAIVRADRKGNPTWLVRLPAN